MKSIYNLLNSKGQLFALGLGLLCIAIVLGSIFSGLGSAGYDTSTDLNQILKDGGGDGFNFLNPAVMIPRLLTILAVAVILIFGIVGLVTNPKGSLVFLIAVGVLVALFFILTSMSEAETTGKIAALVDKNGISEGVSKMISGGVKSVVLLSAIAFFGIVLMEIYNFFK